MEADVSGHHEVAFDLGVQEMSVVSFKAVVRFLPEVGWRVGFDYEGGVVRIDAPIRRRVEPFEARIQRLVGEFLK
jgi:hypothetical protein